MLNPVGVAVESTGHILSWSWTHIAGTGGRGALFRVNALTNVRTLLNDFGTTADGPVLGVSLIDVAVEPSGRILVLDEGAGKDGRGALFRIDPATRKRTLLSDFGNAATGERGLGPFSVAVEASGNILVVDSAGGTNGLGTLYRVNPKDGFRTLLSDFGRPAFGPLGGDPLGVAVEPSGAILVIDEHGGTDDNGVLFRVDPLSGFRTLLSDFGQLLPSNNLGGFPLRVAILPH